MQRNDYCFKSLKSFVREMIDKHRLDFDENNMRDFTDYYLKIDLSNDENKISGFFKYGFYFLNNAIIKFNFFYYI